MFEKMNGIDTAVLVATDPLLPIRIIVGIALVAVIATFIHVLCHLRQIRRTAERDNLVPSAVGPRDNLVLMVCLIPVIVVSLLLFLVLKT